MSQALLKALDLAASLLGWEEAETAGCDSPCLFLLLLSLGVHSPRGWMGPSPTLGGVNKRKIREISADSGELAG